jgi:hypothetical protein
MLIYIASTIFPRPKTENPISDNQEMGFWVSLHGSAFRLGVAAGKRSKKFCLFKPEQTVKVKRKPTVNIFFKR